MGRKCLQIILAEPDDDHAMLTERMLRELGPSHRLTRLKTENDVSTYLLGSTRHRAPDIMMLSQCRPTWDIFEPLRRLRDDVRFQRTLFASLMIFEGPQTDWPADVSLTKPVTEAGIREMLTGVPTRPVFGMAQPINGAMAPTVNGIPH